MKALAIDCAISKLTVACKNEDHTVTAVYDIGMKQSETLLPAIDYVIEKSGIQKSELEYISITQGPGSFTGLRLGLSAAKAIQMAFNIPLYGINTLKVYAEPAEKFDDEYIIISEIDAKKERFYSEAYFNKKTILDAGDLTAGEIIEGVKKASDENGCKKIIICGPDAQLLENQLKEADSEFTKTFKIIPLDFSYTTTDSLFRIAEKMKEKGLEPMNDYDGPVYLRASEAEVKLNV